MADDKRETGPFEDHGEPDPPLAQQLRRLNWPRPPDGVRERTWEQLRDLIPPSAETSVVEHAVRIGAPPQAVFAHFTEAAKLVRWIGTDAVLDPRVGGPCRIRMSGGALMLGEFLAVDPDRRIVLAWGFEDDLSDVPRCSTVVAVSFTPDRGGTLVRVGHRDLPAVAISAHQAGWQHYLKRLAIAATGADPGPDSCRVTASAG